MSGLTFSVASRRLLDLCRRQPSLTKMTQQQPRQEGGALNNLSLQQPRCLMSSEAVWKLGRLNHVAVATPDLAKTSAFYRDVLGAKVSDTEDLPDHGVTTVFVELDNTKIELLHPFGEKSPIQGFLDKNKAGGIHHVCIEVDDIEAAVKTLKEKKIRCLTDSTKIGAHGKPVMFLHPKDCGGVLVELEQA